MLTNTCQLVRQRCLRCNKVGWCRGCSTSDGKCSSVGGLKSKGVRGKAPRDGEDQDYRCRRCRQGEDHWSWCLFAIVHTHSPLKAGSVLDRQRRSMRNIRLSRMPRSALDPPQPQPSPRCPSSARILFRLLSSLSRSLSSKSCTPRFVVSVPRCCVTR